MKMEIEEVMKIAENTRKVKIAQIKAFLINSYEQDEKFVSFMLDENDSITFNTLREYVHLAIRQATKIIDKDIPQSKRFSRYFQSSKAKGQEKLIVEIFKCDL